MIKTSILMIALCYLLGCNAQTKSENDTVESTYPFTIYDTDLWVISAETEGKLYPKYANFFEKLGYSGNGYCWEGHIVQILEKLDPELLSHISFDPEAGGFYAYADTPSSRSRFLKMLCPIFSDLAELEKYVVKADRGRVDD